MTEHEKRTPSWWPLLEGPYVLVDEPADGTFEERCWIPARLVDGDHYKLQRAGAGRLAACLAILREQHLGDVLETIEAATLTLELRDKTVWHRPEVIDRDGGEFMPWSECEPTDENAVQFYVLEVVDA